MTRADILADPASIFTAENLFAFIGKPLGIGGIAMAGIIGIVKQSKIIRQAVGLAVSELGGNKTAPAAVERTQRDLTMKRILTILIATLISVFVFFHFGLLDGWVQSVTAILIVFVISFLFTTVAANAIAIVGTNPVSGMTLMTLILLVAGIGERRAERHDGHDGGADHRRRGLHGALDGRRVHHRPEDRLLARHDAPQAGGLEIPRHVRCCGDRSRGDDHPQQIGTGSWAKAPSWPRRPTPWPP